MEEFHVRNIKVQKFNSFNPLALYSFLTNNVKGEKFVIIKIYDLCTLTYTNKSSFSSQICWLKLKKIFYYSKYQVLQQPQSLIQQWQTRQ